MSIISAGGAVTGADVATPIDPRDYFNTVLYTGNGSNGNAITGVGFQPDLVWGKCRSVGTDHYWVDVVRGVTKVLRSNLTNAEYTQTDGLVSFDSDGFTLDDDNSGGPSGNFNINARTYVAWNWKGNGAGSSNTDGTITSTVSASTDSGFSIVTYTGTGAASATIGHGLGVAPSMLIVKNRTDGTTLWSVYHASVGAGSVAHLNTTAAFSASGDWNSTAPTSTVFSTNNSDRTNKSGSAMVAYCFAEIADFSKIGSYTGNGSATGPSVTTDFQPTWILIKRTDSTGDWIIHDSARDASNPRTAFLEPNTADAEGSGLDVDFNSTGFQIKSSSATVNANGGTYIYMCIA